MHICYYSSETQTRQEVEEYLKGGDSVDLNALGIVRMDHIAIATRRIDDVLPFFELFGMEEKGTRFPNPNIGFTGLHLIVPGGGIEVEVLEPNGDDSYLHQFLNRGGSMLHHVTFHVEDIAKARLALKAQGIEPHPSSQDWEIIIRPSQGHGVFWQLFPADRRFGGPGDHVPRTSGD